LAQAAVGQNTEPDDVRGFVHNWRASRNKEANFYVLEIPLESPPSVTA
jgi:hypothetical protein